MTAHHLVEIGFLTAISRTVAVAALVTLVAAPTMAQTQWADWKYYGYVVHDRPLTINMSVEWELSTMCFYNANGIQHPHDGWIRVWTQCLNEQDVENFDLQTDIGEKVAQSIARKIASGYVPPIATVTDVNHDMVVEFIADETVANLTYVKPVSRIFYEIECSEKMYRELSIYFSNAVGKGSYSGRPTDWKYIPAEGNGANLNKLLCK